MQPFDSVGATAQLLSTVPTTVRYEWNSAVRLLPGRMSLQIGWEVHLEEARIRAKVIKMC